MMIFINLIIVVKLKSSFSRREKVVKNFDFILK
jgi:hypothetical protein